MYIFTMSFQAQTNKEYKKVLENTEYLIIKNDTNTRQKTYPR